MNDINFSDYKKSKRKSAASDTGEIPITRSEREIIDRRNRERYEQIIRNQRLSEQAYTQEQGYYDDGYEAERRKKPPKKKKRRGCASIFVSIILVFALIFGSAVGYAYYLCSKTNYEPSDNAFSIDFAELFDGKYNIYNVLLIGTDKVENGFSRSDTMMLVSIDKNTEKIKLTSFMRDLWVEIPGHGKSRLNAAITKGGVPLLLDTIYENFGVEIDNYLLVDFEMFQKLIDAIGGVTVEITEKEASFINRTTHAKVTAGQNTLNGDYALIYCRIRKLDSDFMRTQRQRKVITAIVEKVKSQNLFKTASAVSEVLPLITTDISPLKMTIKLFGAIGMLDYSAEQLRVPLDGAYSDERINGQAVLVPDYDKNREEVKNFIYE